MQSPKLTLPKLTLPTLLAGVVLALLPPAPAQAAPLNPSGFASLGNNPFTQNGTYTVNTGATPPTLSGPGISSPIRGAVSPAGVAVFTFRSITLPQGATLSAVRDTARPLALLSQGDTDIEGTIDVSGADAGVGGPGGAGGGADSAGGSGSPGGSVEPGGGGAGGQAGPESSSATFGGGGGFGGAGTQEYGGGRPYGDLLTKLEGGSGGGGAAAQEYGGPYPGSFPGGAGGGGGGAVEIGAIGTVTLAGGVNASGGDGGSPVGGGGAGGGILVHGADVAVSAAPLTLSAHGGSGANAGGGGRIVLEADGGAVTGDIDRAIFLSGFNNSNGQIKTVGAVVPYAEDNGDVRVPHRSASGVNFTLTASSARPNGSETDALVYSLLGANGGAQHGTVTLSGSTATYKPNVAADYVGTDTFRFTVYDSTEGLPGDHTGTITVTLTNTAPVAQTDSYRASQSTTLTVPASGVLANDTDTDGDKLSALLVTSPAHAASFALRTDGSFTYTPAAGYFGTDSFAYNASDGHAGSNTATVNLTVVGTPTANNQSVSVPFNTAKAITLTGSDPNSPPQTLTYTVFTAPAHGTLSGTAPNLTYTPTAGYQGADSFTFTVSNGVSTSNPATATLNVAAGIPTATAQSVSAAFNTAKAITLMGVDPDVPALSLTYSVTTNPTHGSLSGFNASTGTVTYTPTAGYHGADSFTFSVSNGTNTSSTATVTISVAAGTPTANAQSVTTSQGTAAAITLAGSDPDVPALPLAYTVATGPTHGTLTGTAPSLTYTPAAGYYGADSFTFTVSNGVNTSAQATVSLTVTQAAASDVTAQVTVTRGGFRYVRATGHYLQPVTLANNGAALADPISLVLDGLAGATLVGASGTTSAAAPSGSPYVTLPAGGLAAGASVTVTLEFTAQPTGYTARVLAGPGAR